MRTRIARRAACRLLATVVSLFALHAGAEDARRPPNLIFWSGFEGGVFLGAPRDCYPNGCFQDLIGVDGGGRFQLITNAPEAPTPATVGSYMRNELRAVTGRTGAPTRALYMHIDRSGCCGTAPQMKGVTQSAYMIFPAAELPELYASGWLRFQDDLAQKLATPGGRWRAFFAIKTEDTDWRLELYAVDHRRTGVPQFMAKADTFVPRHREYWRIYGRPVPIGRWFKYEVYVKRSAGEDGRVWVALDAAVIADQRGPNLGPKGARINRIMLTLLYSGSPYPISQWVDDVQLWSGFPAAKPGDPWYDGVYAPR